jgi:hypothetical protein
MRALRHWSVRHARGPEACYGLFERAFVLVGVGPLRSARAAQWMHTHVPGVLNGRVPWHPVRSTEPQPRRATS